MAIFKDKKTKNYGVRIWYQRNDIRRIVGPDRRAAELAEAALKREIAEAKAAGQEWTGLEKVRKEKKTKLFTDMAGEYMEERAHYKPSTINGYNSILKTYLLPEFGNKPLRAISEASVAKFQSALCQKLSPMRVNVILQLLRTILTVAVRRGHLAANPCTAIDRIQEPKAKIDPLSERELEKTLAVIDSHYQPLFTALAFTGARPNELLALRWSDITWSSEETNTQGTISITKGLVRGHEGLPKTTSSERTIPMVPRVEEALKILHRKSVASLDGYIFLDKKGLPIRKHLDRIWARALRLAGLRHRPSYQLRHTFVSQCLLKGLSPGYVAHLIGHSGLETLYRHYARWINDASKEQERILRSQLGSPKSDKDLAENLAVSVIEEKPHTAKPRASKRLRI